MVVLASVVRLLLCKEDFPPLGIASGQPLLFRSKQFASLGAGLLSRLQVLPRPLAEIEGRRIVVARHAVTPIAALLEERQGLDEVLGCLVPKGLPEDAARGCTAPVTRGLAVISTGAILHGRLRSFRGFRRFLLARRFGGLHLRRLVRVDLSQSPGTGFEGDRHLLTGCLRST